MSFIDLEEEELKVKSSNLNTLLYDLSRYGIGSDELPCFSIRFKELYSGGYRQRYSDIQDVLKSISDNDYEDLDDGGSEEYDDVDSGEDDIFDTLSSNLSEICSYIKKNIKTYGEQTYFGVYKLSDYVDLEIHRYRDLCDSYREIYGMEDNVQDLVENVANMSAEVGEVSSKIEEARNASEKLQMQMVAILGIFAAIVMAFSGGLDILGGAISTSGESDLFKVVFTVVLCGIILFNIFAFLMYMILAIINPRANRPIRRPYGKELKGRERFSFWLDRFTCSRFILTFNILMIVLLAVNLVCLIKFGQ